MICFQRLLLLNVKFTMTLIPIKGTVFLMLNYALAIRMRGEAEV